MGDSIDRAKETIESAGEEAEGGGHKLGDNARNVAVLVAALAAALAITEIGEKRAQNEYLTHHIQASDDWNFYQAKTIRGNLYTLEAQSLESLPNAADPAVKKRIDDARAEAKRLDDDEKTLGRKQLMAKAKASEEDRDHELHRFHLFEAVVGGLEIAIVLASVSVVTRVRQLAIAAAVLGGGGLAVRRWPRRSNCSETLRRSRLPKVPPDARIRGEALAGRCDEEMLIRAVLLAAIVAVRDPH